MKIKINGTVQAMKSYLSDKTDFAFFSFQSEAMGYSIVMPLEIEVDIPDTFNITAAQVATINKRKNFITEEYHQEIFKLDGQLATLQCLEMTP